MNDYEGLRRVVYGSDDEYSGATFVPVCPKCGRFVKADDVQMFKGTTIADQPNATCSRCGRVLMPFEGFVEYGSLTAPMESK